MCARECVYIVGAKGAKRMGKGYGRAAEEKFIAESRSEFGFQGDMMSLGGIVIENSRANSSEEIVGRQRI